MITERTKLMEVERQLAWRETAYPGKVAAGSMRDSDAEFTLRVWRAIVSDYEGRVAAMAGVQGKEPDNGQVEGASND